MLDAGLTPPEAVQALVEGIERGPAPHAEARGRCAARRRELFRRARAPAGVFPALYVDHRAAEKTGDLAEALARYVTISSSTRSGARWCRHRSIRLLLGVGVLVALFLLAYVVPRFAAVYQDLGRELPGSRS